MEVHTIRRSNLIGCSRVAPLHFDTKKEGTMMPLQILINILLAMEYGQFKVKAHRYSRPLGRPSSLLISSNHGSLTCHFIKLIQARLDNEELDCKFGGKRRRKIWVFQKLGFQKKSLKSCLLCAHWKNWMIVWGLNWGIAMVLNSNQTITQIPTNPISQTLATFFCAHQSDAWFDS